MSKKLAIGTLVGILIIFSYSAISFLKIRAYRAAPIIAQSYDEDRSIKFPDTEDSDKRKKALEELAKAIKAQEESSESQNNETFNKALVNPIHMGYYKGEKLDYEALLKLDNVRKPWWIKLNNDHEPTKIPENVKKLIDKYDGIYLGDTSQKKIYLTFDEGYENGYTSKILDTLKSNEVKAVFFITGPYLKQNSDLVKRMLSEGHLVGNHTIHHPSLPDVAVDKLEAELLELDKQFRGMFGTGFKYMRPPRGEYSERVLAASKQLGYKTVFWSFAYMDFDVNDQKGADYAYDKVMKNLHNGSVILLHAVSKDNADSLDRIIKGIKSQGYDISLLDL